MTESDLHRYQITAAEHIFWNEYSGLFLDMGLGKTISTLTAINWLIQSGEVSRVLIIAPKRVAQSVWHKEIVKWDHVGHLKISRVIKTAPKRKQALAEKADIYIIGRDNVSWLCGQYGGSMLPFDMLVIDESSSFKNPKAQRFKALRQVRASFNRIVLLTGTPAPNGLIDIWAQIYLLDGGVRLGKFISNYRDRFFTPNQRNGAVVYNYKLQKDSEDKIHKLIGDICISMKAKDYLELPGVVVNDIEIELPYATQARYDQFEKDQILAILEEEITAVNAAALTNKLLQFANGAVYDEDKNYHVVHDEKLNAVAEILEEAQGKSVLIAYSYRSDLYRLKERFKDYKPRELKTEQDEDDWNRGVVPLLLMHPASGGHGLNLQAGGNIIIWFGNTWSSELYEQLNARLDRQGKTEVTIIHRLIAVKTMDQQAVKSLANKIDVQNSLIEAVKARIKNYRDAMQ